MKTTDEVKNAAGYENTEHIEYTRTIVPSSMRSLYWNYFGFPANDENTILTRQKIICTLCNTAIAYNKNTSNLRTHLIARHPEKLFHMQIQQNASESGISSENATTEAAAATSLRPAAAAATTNKRVLDDAGASLPSAVRLKLSSLDFTTATTTTIKEDDSTEKLYITDDLKHILEDDVAEDDEIAEHDEHDEFQEEHHQPQITTDDDVVELIDPTAAQSQLSVADAAAAAATTHFVDDDFVQHDDEGDDNNVEEHDDTEAESLGVIAGQHYTLVDIVPPAPSALSTSSTLPPSLLTCNQQQQQQRRAETTTTVALDNQTTDEQLIIEMLITDLLPLETVCGRGFQHLLLLCAPLDKRRLEAKICEQYSHMQLSISAQLAEISQKSTYSLSIECYQNLEHSDIYDIYFNYVSNDDVSPNVADTTAVAPELHSILYHSGRCCDMDLEDSLQHLNLEHCGALVVSGDMPANCKTLIEVFSDAQDIPTIECLESVLTRCLTQIFDVPSIFAAFEQNYKLSEDTLLLPTLPEVYASCPWSKLHYLQCVLDTLILNNLNEVSLNEDIRNLLKYLQPLMITLDTIAEEPLPICTLIRPLTVRLYEEHFAAFALALGSSSSYLVEARNIIENEFQKSIINNNFLNEATFFDMRFRNDFIDADSCSRLQQTICARFKRQLVLTHVPKPVVVKMEQDGGASALGSKRKSSLKMFFERINDASTSGHTNANATHAPPTQKTTIDLEFDKYKCEPTLDLEQCPINWWRQQKQQHQTDGGDANYKQLRKLAAYYLCVPACANRLYRSGADANERVAWRQKRARQQQQVGSSNAERCLWYLHYNRPYYEKFC